MSQNLDCNEMKIDCGYGGGLHTNLPRTSVYLRSTDTCERYMTRLTNYNRFSVWSRSRSCFSMACLSVIAVLLFSFVSSEVSRWLPLSATGLGETKTDLPCPIPLSPWAGPSSLNDSRNCSLPLKVYMYDLPRKFNVGIMTRNDSDGDKPWPTDEALPPWPALLEHKWKLYKQHSVEYWMMKYLWDGWDSNDGTRAAVRVQHPEEADVFFVPFFASLSFNIYGYRMQGPEAEHDKRLQEGVWDILMKKKSWNASQGRDHIFVIHHPNAFRHYHVFLKNSILIVADFGRFPVQTARLSKDIVAPYDHVVESFDINNDLLTNLYSQRPTLLYFRGRVHRKDDGLVRVKLAEVLMNQPDVHYVDSEANSDTFAETTTGMRSSRFCLHPAGDTPSSCRLFDAIASHCVPVIVSDKIELPFEDDINYNECALFFSSEDAVEPGHLLRALRGVTTGRWLEMWTKLKAVSHHFEFQHPARKDDAVNMVFKQVQRKLPSVKLAVHRSERLRIIPDWEMEFGLNCWPSRRL